MRFSLVVAIRDTPQERKFAQRSLLAAGRLRPTETIIGLDDPPSQDFLEVINAASSQHPKPRIIHVARSSEWNMHLAHVIDECYQTTSCERILTYNIDSILQRRIMDECNRVSPQTPLIMYQEKRCGRTSRDLITGIIYRMNQIIATPDSGTYWIHRQSYFDHVDTAGFRKIFNGYDTFLIEQLRASGKSIVAESAIGTHNLDYNNNDIPWRQFANGVWYGANPDKITGYFAGRPGFKIHVKSILLDMPYLYRGFKWARKNADHPAVKEARSSTFLDFAHQGSNPVEGILNWEKTGKLGVGYT